MSYSPIIQESIAYIETHLPEELSLESMAKFAGFKVSLPSDFSARGWRERI